MCMHVCVCVKAAVVVLPYVGFTVSHFNDTHSSTQAAIVHPSVQPGNMDKKIQMWAQLMHFKNVTKSGGLELSTTIQSKVLFWHHRIFNL